MNCLDTSFLIDILRGTDRATQLLEEMNGRHAVSPISAAELWIGAHMGSVSEYHQTEELLQSLVWLPFDRDVARRTGSIQARQYDSGNPLPFNDCAIAATAIEYGHPVVTRDSYFDQIDRLEVITY